MFPEAEERVEMIEGQLDGQQAQTNDQHNQSTSQQPRLEKLGARHLALFSFGTDQAH